MDNRFIITIPYTIEHFPTDSYYAFIRNNGACFLELYYKVDDNAFTFTHRKSTLNAPFQTLSETDLCYVLEHVLLNFDEPFKKIVFNHSIQLPNIGEIKVNDLVFVQNRNKFLKKIESDHFVIDYDFELKLFNSNCEITFSIEHINNELFLDLNGNHEFFIAAKDLIHLMSKLETTFKFDCINIAKNIFGDGYFDPQLLGFRNYKTVSDYVHFYDRIGK